ncbi:MAG: hypothetical protein AMXMBFR4_12090 [Candidatus Hydrogenedentota bacterium]
MLGSIPEASILVPIALFTWPLVLGALFMAMPSRRAVISGFIGAWLFLPVAEYQFAGFPEYNKMTATSASVFIMTLLFDPNRVMSFRPKWIDLPMVALILCPMASSLSNELGPYDGMSECNGQLIRWGLPYFIGRIYFNDVRSMRELAIGVFIGGLIYMPFCWFEMRMSPQLHRIVYGFMQHGFMQTIRYGGYRPMVFLQHGLMVGMWMATATLCGLALWRTGSLRQVRGISIAPLIAMLFVTTFMCRSTGAILLMFVGFGLLFAVKYLRTSLALHAVAGIVVVYIAFRAIGLWSGDRLVDFTDRVFGNERASSVETRVYNEEMLTAKARQQVLFGWGGWGRSRIFSDSGQDISVTDSQWVITFGTNGAVGLTALLTAMLLPPLALGWRIPVRYWPHPLVSATGTLAVVVVLWMADNTMNAMFNPIYIVITGGLAAMQPLTQADFTPIVVRRIRPQPFVPRRKRHKPAAARIRG